MFLGELKKPITCLKGVGPDTAKKLARLGINTLAGLFCHYPRGWEDHSRPIPLKDWNKGPVCTEVKVLAHDWFWYNGKRIPKVYVEDETARASLACYKTHLEKKLPTGTRRKIYGQFYYKHMEIQSSNFEVDLTVAETGVYEFGLFPPLYPLTEGISMRELRKLMRQAIDKFAPSLMDELPESIISRDALLRKPDAIRAIHFPASLDELEKAKKTLIYEELFYLEVMVGRRALQRKGTGSGEQGIPQSQFSSPQPPVPSP